jgi:hypothetical protein
MELDSDATFQEERVEVLVSVRDALRTSGRDPGLRAAAGLRLRHLASAGLINLYLKDGAAQNRRPAIHWPRATSLQHGRKESAE